MKVIKYNTELDAYKKNILVMENSTNYTDSNSLATPKEVSNMFNTVFHANRQSEEHMWALALTTTCTPIGVFEISHGTATSSLANPRELFTKLCLCGAVNFILVHNHPSGNCTASQEDIDTTKRIKEASEIMGINFLDHIILGDTFVSLREQKLI